MSGFNDGFGGAFDQETIDERNNAPSAKKRKKGRSSEKLREAQQAYEEHEMKRELGLIPEVTYDE